MQSQQSLMLIKNQGFFPANLSYTNGLGDLHHLLAWRPVNILKNLFFSNGDYSKVRRQPPKSTG